MAEELPKFFPVTGVLQRTLNNQVNKILPSGMVIAKGSIDSTEDNRHFGPYFSDKIHHGHNTWIPIGHDRSENNTVWFWLQTLEGTFHRFKRQTVTAVISGNISITSGLGDRSFEIMSLTIG